jgi:DNA-binding LacI/PurR family transcriptional regulator
MSLRSPLHRYEEIAEEIRVSLNRGAFGPDGRLPSERWFGKTYAAQRNTVRQALGLLEREGKVESVGKSGWFITKGETRRGKETLAGQRVMLVTFRRPSGSTIDHLTQGLREVLNEKGIELLRYDSQAHEEAQHIETIEQLTTVDAGAIVMWPHNSVDKSLLARLQASTPLILVDRRVFGFESDSVLFDDLKAGQTITEHLISNGHRRIAFLGDEPFAESVQNRWRGYRQALEGAGIVPDENLTTLVYGRHEPAFSRHIRILLQEKPTAIVCSNDGVASCVLLILREDKVRTPEDIAVTGFGNDASGYLDVIGLTTMSQPFGQIGREAGRLLLERLTEPPINRAPANREVWIPMDLVVRASSSPNAKTRRSAE